MGLALASREAHRQLEQERQTGKAKREERRYPFARGQRERFEVRAHLLSEDSDRVHGKAGPARYVRDVRLPSAAVLPYAGPM